MDIRNSPQFVRGTAAERLVKRLLEEHGWFIKRQETETGKAPLMSRVMDAGVLPDLDVMGGGQSCWVEVKCYTDVHLSPVQRYSDGKKMPVHGIPYRNYKEYLGVQKESGRPVFLAILEESTGDVLCRRLNDLVDLYHGNVDIGPSYNRKDGSRGEPQVYFRRDFFHVLFNINDPRVDGSDAVFRKPGPAVRCAETMGEKVFDFPRIKASVPVFVEKQGILFDEAFFR